MGVWELCLLAAGLSMDAFAVSICKGLSAPRPNPRQAVTVGLYFGGFQAVMPLLGYLLGSRFAGMITHVDHWIAFILLVFIGVNMLRESREAAAELDPSFSPRAMLPLAVATSIDALAVGVTFAFLQVSIGLAVGLIGGITFCLSAVAFCLGQAFGTRCKGGAEAAGGVILILMGSKILLEHLGILG